MARWASFAESSGKLEAGSWKLIRDRVTVPPRIGAGEPIPVPGSIRTTVAQPDIPNVRSRLTSWPRDWSSRYTSSGIADSTFSLLNPAVCGQKDP